MSTPKNKRERLLRRTFEIIPPIISLLLLSSPFWASFFIPVVVAYFIIFFDVYFFYRAAMLGINSTRAYFKIRRNLRIDWLEKLKLNSLP